MKIKITQRQILSFFLLTLFIIISIAGIKEMILVLPLLAILVNSSKASYIEILYCLSVGCILTILISLRAIEFSMFPQAAVLYASNEDVFYWMAIGHVHAIRLFVVYPGALLSKFFGFELNMGVTIYSASLLVLIMYFMMRVMNINRRENKISAVMSGLLIIILSYFMNGRLIFVFFGISLLALYELKFRENEASVFMLQLVTAIAIIFTMVSSGTMFVAFIYVILIMPYRWKKLNDVREKQLFVLILLISAIPVMIIFVPYLIKMTERNIVFYGGGFQGAINLINHGLGKIVNTNNKILVFTVFVMGAIAVITNIYLFDRKIIKRAHPDLPLLLMVNLSAYGSIFGLSTGLTALIPLLVLIIEKMNKNIKLV